MKEIILIGGGGHCKSVIDVIEQEGRFNIVGVIDKPELLGTKVLDYSVIGNDSDMVSLAKKHLHAIVTVGQIKLPAFRIKLFNMAVKAGFVLPNITSPRSYVSKHAIIGDGTIIMHDVLINANVTIDDNCIINSKALIEHDCIISKHCHISTNAIINGSVIVESECFVGSGSIIKESITVNKGSFIKAGTVVK
jgi:sugar O-acyltransferase (sialic acid O-acetyltransferase NeuD family)